MAHSIQESLYNNITDGHVTLFNWSQTELNSINRTLYARGMYPCGIAEKLIRHGSHRACTTYQLTPIRQITEIAPSINPSLDSDCTTMLPTSSLIWVYHSPNGYLMGHLSIFRFWGANKTLFDLFTVHIVPLSCDLDGHTNFGECWERKAEIHVCKKCAEIEIWKMRLLMGPLVKSLLLRVQSVPERLKRDMHENYFLITFRTDSLTLFAAFRHGDDLCVSVVSLPCAVFLLQFFGALPAIFPTVGCSAGASDGNGGSCTDRSPRRLNRTQIH